MTHADGDERTVIDERAEAAVGLIRDLLCPLFEQSKRSENESRLVMAVAVLWIVRDHSGNSVSGVRERFIGGGGGHTSEQSVTEGERLCCGVRM